MNGSIRLVGTPRGAALQDQIQQLASALNETDAVVIGAGAGLSTSAGLTYAGPRFRQWFGDFIDRYGFTDMYTGGFYPFDTLEEHWAYWSRHIYCNRYDLRPPRAYTDLLALVRGRDYFVLTTNVDHQFQLAGFDKQRLFYTQGDYGLWQCSEPCHQATYDNGPQVRAMLQAQGYVEGPGGALVLPAGTLPRMEIPSDLVPRCPRCGKPMSMNLRADATFVEDEGWHAAAARWSDFQRRHQNMRVLYLELGVGWNTPGIIKLPFWQAAARNPRATYACINQGEAVAPADIERQAVLIDADIAEVLAEVGASLGESGASLGSRGQFGLIEARPR